jgi:hypothetical protein
MLVCQATSQKEPEQTHLELASNPNDAFKKSQALEALGVKMGSLTRPSVRFEDHFG